MAHSLTDDLDLLVGGVRAAGELALTFVGKSPKSWSKGNNSPVTEVDIAVEVLLAGIFRVARPDYGWLSEESEDDGSRLQAARTFVIDPIDGTSSFIAGGTDWTIPIAIIEGGRPVAAALIAPRRDELYTATAGGGAVLNGAPIRVSGQTALEGATLSISRRMPGWSKGKLPAGAVNTFYTSLAYRVARVADGRTDGVAVRANAQDWDLAAADLLVHEAGGVLCDLDGRAPRYDRAETAHPPLVAGTPALIGPLLRITRVAVGADQV